MIEHRTVRTNGISLHVAFAGPPSGRPLLLLHGFPDFWWTWRAQIEPLVAAGFRLVMPDQRGYNTSEKPPGVSAYGRDTLANDAVGILDALRIQRATVIGHDLGGAVAWWIAHQHAERLDKLVVLNCPHPVVMERTLRSNLAQLRRSWYILFFQLPLLPEAYFARADFVPALRWLEKASGCAKEDLAKYRDAWSQPGAVHAMIQWYRAAARVRPYQARNRSILAPTRLIWGTNDIALGEEMAAPSIAGCLEGRVVRVEGAGHWVHQRAAERVNTELLGFL